MRSIRTILLVFLGIGGVLLACAAVPTGWEVLFIRKASSTQGTVLRLEENESRSSDGAWSTTYCPVVTYAGPLGKPLEFTSSTCNSHTAFQTGQQVGVLFDPTNPAHAQIDAFWSHWLGAFVCVVLGIVFGAVGLIPLVIIARARATADWLQRNGKKVVAALLRAEVNEMLVVNGRSPFRLVAQWQDPVSSKLYLFYSDNVWFDPNPYLADRKSVEVFIDPRDPRRHHTNLSFLPQLAQ